MQLDDLFEADWSSTCTIAFALKEKQVVICPQARQFQDLKSRQVFLGCLILATVDEDWYLCHFTPRCSTRTLFEYSIRVTGIARGVRCCYIETVMFDSRRFYEAVDRHRADLDLSWRQVAAQLSLSPSTFTRLAQGRRPDVDTFVKLLAWVDRPAEDFVKDAQAKIVENSPTPKDTVREIADSLRSDPNLTSESADALEDIVKVAYHRFRDA